MLTQERVKELLHYCPVNGIFKWRINKNQRAIAGSIAGCLSNKGYVCIKVDSKSYLAHRLAWLYMYGDWPLGQIDHKNHSRNDNRFSNLRVVTNQENHRNRTKQSNNTSGVTGVYWNKALKKWRSVITIDRKSNHIGLYEDKFEAICARKSAENKYGYHHNHGK